MKAENEQPPYFGRFAATFADNGYSVVAVKPNSKKPYLKRWSTACFKPSEPAWIERHARSHPGDSIAIACGSKVSIR
jgi:hypothetical protein